MNKRSISSSKRLLLISNSKVYGKGYLDHVVNEIVDFLGEINEILFIPYALRDRDMYESIAKDRFNKLKIKLESIHKSKDPIQAISSAKAIFIGGGNTFRLLNELYKTRIMDIIRNKIGKGVPFIGSSAGVNVACPTIKTTNDMPIVYPASLDALNLVSFQINSHYIDSDANSKHMGETREQRIKEFHEENNYPVVGLREGAWLRIENQQIFLKGSSGAKVFIKGKKPLDVQHGTKLNFLNRKI